MCNVYVSRWYAIGAVLTRLRACPHIHIVAGTGLRASQMCMGWALAVVAEARRRGRLEKPEGVTLGNKLLNLEADVYSLFNYQYALDLDPSTSLWTYCGWR